MNEVGTFASVITPPEQPQLEDIYGENGYYRSAIHAILRTQNIEIGLYGSGKCQVEGVLLVFCELQTTIDYLTRPRSIEDFISLKREIYEAIKAGDLDRGWKAQWVVHLLNHFGILSPDEVNGLEDHSIDEVLSWSDNSSDRERISQDKKMIRSDVHVSHVVEHYRHRELYPKWKGFIGGKWRDGLRPWHIDTLAQARRVLGNGIFDCSSRRREIDTL